MASQAATSQRILQSRKLPLRKAFRFGRDVAFFAISAAN
jgi:hypothetical protein